MVQYGELYVICLPESIFIVFQAGVVSEWSNDCQRFLLEHFDTIQNSPSHIYHSALPLSPHTSWLYRYYIAEASSVVKIIMRLPTGQGAYSRTILLDNTQTLSCHNNSIAAGSESGDITILDAITGSQSAILSGHEDSVSCVVFSPDGTLLVSGSWDKTVKLWDVQTGGVVKTFFGHTGSVLSVSISADSTTIASGSNDKTIRLWSIQMGGCYHMIQQHQAVCHVIFSPKDPQHLISRCVSEVWQWDANGCQIRLPFAGSHVAFSSDGTQFVSCYKKDIVVHNLSSEETATEFQTADNSYLCCFSPDNRLLAVAAYKTIYCYDITTSAPQLVVTFIDHTEWITSLVFSSTTTLVSASEDNSIKFWQVGAQSTDPAITNLGSTFFPFTRIKSIILQSKERIAITCASHGVIRAYDISTGICRASHQAPPKSHYLRDVQFVNSRLILVWYADNKIHVWDAKSGALLWETDKPQHKIYDLRISGDGSKVFGLFGHSYMANSNFIWAWSLQTGEAVGGVIFEGMQGSGSLIVDGLKVWACSTYSYQKGWDFGITGSAPMELPNISTPPSPSRLWNPQQAWIMNQATGEVVFQLSGRYANPCCVQCNDSCLVAGYRSGEILILDLTNVK